MNDFIESLVLKSKQQTTGKRDEILHSCKWAEDDVQRQVGTVLLDTLQKCQRQFTDIYFPFLFDCQTFKANIVVIYNIKENCVLLVGYITRLSIFDTNVVGSGLAWRLVTSGGYQEVLAIVTRPSCAAGGLYCTVLYCTVTCTGDPQT